MESVLLKANLVNLSTGQYWLKIDEEKGMSDREGHGHKAVLYKSHFPPLRHSVHSFSQRHHCIHRLINHVYTQRPKSHYLSVPHDKYHWVNRHSYSVHDLTTRLLNQEKVLPPNSTIIDNYKQIIKDAVILFDAFFCEKQSDSSVCNYI